MKLLIVDDHPILREGVAEILRQALPDTTVLQARNVDEGISLINDQSDLDAIFLDLNFPTGGGMSAIADFVRLTPGTPLIIFSSSEDPSDVRKALAHGAMGYVPKSASAQTLVSALRLVLSGNVYLPPLLADSATTGGVLELGGRTILTERQLEVLEAICRGLSNKDIGLQLDLSEKTVKTHITAIFRALNVVNRTQAVNAARSAKLVAS
ncbi:MAG: response regulator transcription factor [Alphaproteobacteria bacterium]|nr:response regulator transcription factor [Alphaproteobacteria bacterium]MDE1987352.1 response regulator transcription factor [Alphaproteobacteria bacterium]MDE2500192.1 response regulator transcription factor [Alphaproteobacteria bacterium]